MFEAFRCIQNLLNIYSTSLIISLRGLGFCCIRISSSHCTAASSHLVHLNMCCLSRACYSTAPISLHSVTDDGQVLLEGCEDE